MIRPNRSTIKSLSEQGAEGAEADDAERQSRIASNLAKLNESTPAMARNTPLQWKGYAWRTFDTVRGIIKGNPADVAGADKRPLVSAGAEAAGASTLAGAQALPTAVAHGFKHSVLQGFKQRQWCRVILPLALAAAVAAICLVLAFSFAFGRFFARDPCEVAESVSVFLKTHPRTGSKLDASWHPGPLPKIIHQQWKTKDIPPGPYTTWHNKHLELYPRPEWTHMIWTDENARELIKSDYPFFLKTYDSYEWGIQRADAVRYFVLHKYGGMYVDLDYESRVNFWDRLPQDRVGLVESPYQYNEKAQNSLMSSPKGDPFWNETFVLLMERSTRPVLHATGPMFLDALLKHATEPLHLLPCENFQRLPLHLTAEEEVSPFMSQLHRELLGRLVPMKYCGDYHDDRCQYGKHHNTASYLSDTGVLNLLWTR